MKKYDLRVTIRNEYVISVLANTAAEAYRIGENENPEDFGDYIGTERDTDIEEEHELTKLLEQITGTEWWIGTNGNTHTRYATEVAPNAVVAIVDSSEHNEAPHELDDAINVLLITGEWEQDQEVKWGGTLRQLLDDQPETLREIADEATLQTAKCGTCGLSLRDCEGVSAHADIVRTDLERLIQILGEASPMTQSIRTALDGFLTNSIPECAEGSRA